MDLVVMTCDAYQDTWEAFFKLKDKYWDCKYDTYLVTETKDCPYSKTIKTTGAWTKRLREALEQLDNEYVIFMLDDFFLRSKVDQERIDGIIKHFDSNTAVFNTERYNLSKTTEKSVYGFKNRQNKQMYLCSCQPSIWNREKLISLLQQDMTPWEWETQILDSEYKFYINKGDTIFDIGYYEDKKPWAIVQGKWATECRELFKKEKIKVDFYERGFLDMKLSIIIPYRDTYDMACKLLDKLTKQATKDVEIILIDDGCNEDWSKYDIRVINKEQTKWRSASPGRNMGLDIAQGKYIAFIDADDMVVDNYIETVLNKCNEDFDYCYMSWKDSKGKKVIIDNEPPEWNQSVWNGIYKRETIGKHRFKETTQYGEELDFILKVRRGVKGTPILGPIYIYNVGVEGGLTDLFCKGLIDREAPLTAQVVMYLRFISKLGGVETFVYEWIKRFHKEHDI
ncbi:MAG: glycosyltransferase family A protein, partial [Tenuifilaceae bacterium]|nr:glycosyltransferase family A protein [Tenuifilaceae bacterium]